MTETYTNDIADVVASYPGAAYTARQILNRANDYLEVTENITVPASADDDGLYRVELNHGILQTATLTVTINSVVLTPIQYGQSPSSGEVGVNYAGVPVLQFHASLAGLTGTAVYTPLGTVVSSGILNRLQAEIAAMETALVAAPPHVQNTDTGTSSATWVVNSGASGTNDSCTLTLRMTDSDEVVSDYKLHATADLYGLGMAGVGMFIDGTTAYAPFAASAFYGAGVGLTDVPVTALPPGGSWPALTSDLVVGPLTVNSAADGADYKSVEIAAPTSGTNRYTLNLAAPSGGTINGSLRSQGYLYLGTGSKCMYESTSYWYFNNCNSYRFYGSNRGIHLDVWSGGCKLHAYNYSGDSDGFTIQSQSETLTLATLANNKNIILTPHGTGVVSVSAAQISGSHADGLTIAVTTASKPLTLTPGSGAKVETAAQLKAAGFEAGVAAGITTTFVDNDGNTITVTGGIITAKTAP